MSDERQRLPSASAAERYYHCRASFLMEQMIGEQEKESEAAATGTRIHAAIAGELEAETDTEQSIADKAKWLEGKAVADYLNRLPEREFREKRLWYQSPHGNRVFSGQPDYVASVGTRFIIVDFKTLWGQHASAPSNLQLRALVVLVATNFRADHIRVALVEPNKWPSITVADYGPDEILQAIQEIVPLMESVLKPHKPTPHPDACKYCKARRVCPAAISETTALQPITGNAVDLSGKQIAGILDRCLVAEHVVAENKAAAKRLLGQNPDAIPGWRLKPNAPREKITNVQTVFGRALHAGVTQERFTQAVSLTKSALKSALKETGLKGKELDKTLESVVEGCTESTQTSPSLERIKE